MIFKRTIINGGRVFALALLLLSLAGVFFPREAVGAEPGKVTLTVNQSVSTEGLSAAASTETFSYRLAPMQASNPMPDGGGPGGYEFTITGTGNKDVGPIAFTHEGKYSYEISPAGGARPGYTCDEKVYTVEVYVDSKLKAAVVVYGDAGLKAESIDYAYFHDLRPTDPSLMVDPPVVKTVSGTPPRDSVFTFKLTAGDPSNPMPAGSVNGVKTLHITGSGSDDFGTWSYTEEGVYFYTVSEVNTRESGYVYDTAVYTITDTVRAEGNRLTLDRVVTNSANRQVTSLSYINTWAKAGGIGGGGGSGNGGGNGGASGNGGGGNNNGGSGSNGGNGGNPGLLGKYGPKTGDESNATMYIIIISVAGLSAMGSATWLLAGGRCKRGNGENES